MQDLAETFTPESVEPASARVVHQVRSPLESNPSCDHLLYLDCDYWEPPKRVVCLLCGRHSYLDGTRIRLG